MNDEIKNAIRQFAITKNDIDWANCLSVTLTMRQSVGGELLDEINASRNMRHFLSRLNKKVFGNSFDRFGCQVNVIPVQERTERIHYHLLIEISEGRDKGIVIAQIQECWGKTKFGYQEICIEEFDDDHSLLGWSNYITKFKNNDSDQLDWENYHWN